MLGPLGFLLGLAALGVGRIDLRPPGREEDGVAITTCACLLAQVCRKTAADQIGAGKGVAHTTIEVNRSTGLFFGAPAGSGCVPGSYRAPHQQLRKARRIGPRQRAAARSNLLLDDSACILGNTEISAPGQLGKQSGLTGAGTAGDDIKGWLFHFVVNPNHSQKKNRARACDIL